ncbi:MAG: 2-dehydropantoate 2-reductase [Alphaproteobacteria bacterium]|nr:2-dehydropantoate 2-reductase [Alphaproteobacteria bacterium]
MNRICIFGAGAIGSFIGARLAAHADLQVSAVARGATLKALDAHGWRLRHAGETVGGPAIASADPSDLGEQDLVVIAVKGPAMGAVAETIAPLIGPETVVLPAMNGVPWWFGDGMPALGAAPLESVDPGGAIAAAIPARQVLGCVVHAAAIVAEPGLVEHRMGNGLILGEPDGSMSPRLERVVGLLTDAGFEATASRNIRHDIWYKLWGNLTMNPVSAMTGATADRILDDPLVRSFCSAAMREAAEIGRKIGCTIDQSPDDRHDVTRKLGAFKTSMLQDVEAGRALELDAIVASVSELGRRLGVDTPFVDGLLGLTRLFARSRGLY